MKEYEKLKDLSVGDRAPDFTLPSKDGGEVSLDDLLGKGPVVVYFYPRDDTPGCTAEACSFRDSYEDFKDAGAEIVGISSDDAQKHEEFARRHSLPFILLSDGSGEVRKRFRVPKTFGLMPGRVTFVLDSEGTIRYIFSSQFKATEHISRTLDIIKNM